MNNKAIFIDRDGTVIEERHLLHKCRDVKLLDGAAKVIKKIKFNDYKIIIITNQSVISRGICSENKLTEIHQHLKELLVEKANVHLDSIYYCPHHPEADVKKYRRNCICRKPRPGMLLEAQKKFNLRLKQCYMIGDRITDVIAGHAAGCKTILFGNNPNAFEYNISPDKFDKKIEPNFLCKDWATVERIILPLV